MLYFFVNPCLTRQNSSKVGKVVQAFCMFFLYCLQKKKHSGCPVTLAPPLCCGEQWQLPQGVFWSEHTPLNRRHTTALLRMFGVVLKLDESQPKVNGPSPIWSQRTVVLPKSTPTVKSTLPRTVLALFRTANPPPARSGRTDLFEQDPPKN